MEEDNTTVTSMSSTSFLAEIMLILTGLSGISVVGVNIGFFHSLPVFVVTLGLLIGILAIIMCIIGIYVLLYQDYFRLKLFLQLLTLFVGIQSGFIIYLYFFTTYTDSNDYHHHHHQQGVLIALDVCCGLGTSALIALCFHLKQKGSTMEMFKF
ncbi:unnamed protein product [Rotaria socialis]|uniref:Uncharacterized protein n=1 Tax=Rotaria socialis TaxID=392032 RepID=A0A821JV82_9BILA|nr:unnamed protein product [Rotaria socialis]CAF3336684.1 unnamed protein product [Rotaria socialis]CAF3351427.1 unnamed protein product [Rotaria socialis]CAF3389511.1 unnamed protein product [Rotaria socialis]CAF3518020.1 unnamed protein product [Rotaria socialis]